jgi:hypothetical protein
MMKKISFLLFCFFFLLTAAGTDDLKDKIDNTQNNWIIGKLIVTHTPNPCDLHHSPSFDKDPYPFMWYYRTEVKNKSTVPLKIIWFEAFRREGDKWIPGNITGHALTTEDFIDWYTEGDIIKDGVILPGQTAVCDPNWHGSEEPYTSDVKWAYKAVDPDGNIYYAEEIVVSVPVQSIL